MKTPINWVSLQCSFSILRILSQEQRIQKVNSDEKNSKNKQNLTKMGNKQQQKLNESTNYKKRVTDYEMVERLNDATVIWCDLFLTDI